MSFFTLDNNKITFTINSENGGIQSILDKGTGCSYDIAANTFYAVIDGERFFENACAVNSSATENGLIFSYEDRGVLAKLEYILCDEEAFVEKKLSFQKEGTWTINSVLCDGFTFAKPAQQIIFHDDQTIWHVPTNYFVRYETGGLFCGLEYPFWDTNTDGDLALTLGFSPNYTVHNGDWFTSETVFLGAYRMEGITRHSHGPYPGGKKSPYYDIIGGGGLSQHFKNFEIPEDVGIPEETLDWGEVWAMQAFFRHHLPVLPLPEEGFWLFQNGWWAGLFSTDTKCLTKLVEANIKDVMLAAMCFGHDNHPSTEVNYVRDVRIDPVGFPIYENPDTQGVQNGSPGWHKNIDVENNEAGILGYSDTFEAPMAYDEFIKTAQDMGIYASTFCTPNLAYTKRPDWLALHEDGKAHEYFGTRLSCPACDEYMDFHFEVLSRMIDRYPGRLWSFDGRWMNYRELAGYHFGSIGEDKCYSTEHGHPIGDSKYKEWKNIQKFKKKMRDRYPNKCIEQYYGLKRGGAWALTHLNADENYYEMASVENNRFQTWHNENSRFRPVYLNYSSIFGTDPQSFEYSLLSTFSTAYYGQISKGYQALEQYPECIDILKKWKKWADDNHRFFKNRRCLFGEPGEYTVDGSAHMLADEGLIYIFSAPGNFADVRIPFTRWIGLDENKDAKYHVSVEHILHRTGEEKSCDICSDSIAYGEEFRCRLSPDTALILRVKPQKDSDEVCIKQVNFMATDEIVNAF